MKYRKEKKANAGPTPQIVICFVIAYLFCGCIEQTINHRIFFEWFQQESIYLQGDLHEEIALLYSAKGKKVGALRVILSRETQRKPIWV